MDQKKQTKSKTKKKLMTVLFVLLNIAVIAWTALKEFGGEGSSTRFSDVEINYLFIIPAALCCCVPAASAMRMDTDTPSTGAPPTQSSVRRVRVCTLIW